MVELPNLDPVRDEVRKLASGRRRTRFLVVLGRSITWGAVLVAALAWFASPGAVLWLALAVVATSLMGAAVAAVLVPVDPIAVAKRYDDRVGTKDLLSSSLELEVDVDGDDGRALGPAFVAAVREDAVQATGRADSSDLYPVAVPREVRWLPLPVAVAVAALLLPLMSADGPRGPSVAERDAMLGGADRIEELIKRENETGVSDLRADQLARMKNLAEVLRKEDTGKRDALAELARLASQLDKEREEMEGRKLQVEKNAAKLARGEDTKDARQDMDAGRYREAANKVKKKIGELAKKLKEAIEKKAAKLEIEKLRKRIAKLRELLAELEQLDVMGHDLGFLVDVLEQLERIEGELGELGEFDGLEFDEVELGRGPRRPRQVGDQEPRKLFAMPSNDAGEGHAKKVLGAARRSLSEGEEKEAKLHEGKGKSSFGQVKTANDGSRSKRAYEEAFLAAKRAADDVIYRQNIPAGYRTYIRRYFETMQPDDERGSEMGK